MTLAVDTSTVRTYYLYIYVEHQTNSAINLYSNMVTLNVKCGGETISVLNSNQILVMSAYPLSSSIHDFNFDPTIYSTAVTTDRFSSSNSNCEITTFEAYSDSALSTLWSDA
jgi:hypothetical protein